MSMNNGGSMICPGRVGAAMETLRKKTTRMATVLTVKVVWLLVKRDGTEGTRERPKLKIFNLM